MKEPTVSQAVYFVAWVLFAHGYEITKNWYSAILYLWRSTFLKVISDSCSYDSFYQCVGRYLITGLYDCPTIHPLQSRNPSPTCTKVSATATSIRSLIGMQNGWPMTKKSHIVLSMASQAPSTNGLQLGRCALRHPPPTHSNVAHSATIRCGRTTSNVSWMLYARWAFN